MAGFFENAVVKNTTFLTEYWLLIRLVQINLSETRYRRSLSLLTFAPFTTEMCKWTILTRI